MSVTQDLILSEWENKRNIGTERGTELHLVYEDMWKGKRSRGSYHSIFNIKQANPHLIVVDTEVIVGDSTLGIWGMVDVLLLNLKTNKFQLRDLKTDDEIKTKNHWQKLFHPFEELDDCNFNRYTIKINVYRHLIERATSIEIEGDMFIDHVNKNSYDYTEYKLPYIEITDSIIEMVMKGENKNFLNFKI